MFVIFYNNHSNDIKSLLNQSYGEKMGIVVVIILIAGVITIGVFWGKHTIDKDTQRKIMDEEQLDKLHQLRK
jgi:hypothetical protein